MSEHNHHQRFRELLPFYLTRKLDGAERRFIADYLRRHPEAMPELNTTRRAYRYVRSLGAHRNLDQCSAIFLHRLNRPPSLGRWRRLIGWIDRRKNSLVLWAGSAAAAPAVLIDDLDVVLVRFGNATVEFLRIPDALEFIERLFTPAVVQSLKQLGRWLG